MAGGAGDDLYVVDNAGERYLNESLPYDQFGRAMDAHDDNGSAVPSFMISLVVTSKLV